MRSKRLHLGLIAVLVLLIFVACGSSDDSGESTQPADSAVSATPLATTAPVTAPAAEQEDAADAVAADAPTDEASADPTAVPASASQQVEAGTRSGVASALWGDNVTVTVSDTSFRFESDGLPNHELPDQFLIPIEGNMPPFNGDDIAAEFEIRNTDGLIAASPLDIEITLDPVYSDEITETSLSTIGVMISGAALFNDYEDQTRVNIALDDNLSLDGVFFIDACNGHPLASGSSYHYHGVPYCITDQVDVAGQHSTIIGVLLDGFPIYGPQDVDGITLTNADLDECSGHVGPTPEFPEGIYHYHLTEDANPYSIDCFHGVIDYGSNAGGPPPGDGGPPADGERPDGPPPGDGEAPADGAAPADGEAPAGGPPAGEAPADGEAPAGGPPAGEAPADGEAPAGGPPADGEAPADGETPAGGPPGGGQGQAPDFAAAAATLGITEAELQSALGGPPPDFDAAAATLGITVERLQAALDAAS